MSLVKPIALMRMPSDLAGVTNGSVPVALLSPCGVISGYKPFPEFAMHHLASRAMLAMMDAARIAGFTDVRATGAGRTFQQQVSIFDGANYQTGRYLPENAWKNYPLSKWALPIDIRSWPGHGRWKRIAGTAMAAVPGTSNHGWWLAIDFSEEYDGNPFTVEGITTAFTKWLIANAMRFGYSAEAQSEDWHWRYVAGDNVPAEVLAYEARNQSHTPNEGEEEMKPQFVAVTGLPGQYLWIPGMRIIPFPDIEQRDIILKQLGMWDDAKGEPKPGITISNEMYNRINAAVPA